MTNHAFIVATSALVHGVVWKKDTCASVLHCKKKKGEEDEDPESFSDTTEEDL